MWATIGGGGDRCGVTEYDNTPAEDFGAERPIGPDVLYSGHREPHALQHLHLLRLHDDQSSAPGSSVPHARKDLLRQPLKVVQRQPERNSGQPRPEHDLVEWIPLA